MKKKNTWVIALGTILAIFESQIPASADAGKTIKLDTPEIRAELAINEDWMPGMEDNIHNWLRTKIVGEAKTWYDKGDYQKALDILKRANDLCPGEAADQLTSKTLAHLNRRDEALAIIPKLYWSDWDTKVDIYETLGMHSEAIAVCDAAPAFFEEPLLHKIEVLRKMGDKQKAIETAQNARWHMIRSYQNVDKFDAALRNLGVSQLSDPPRVTMDNEAMFALIEKILTLGQPRTKEQLKSIFHETFEIGGIVWPNDKFPTLDTEFFKNRPYRMIGLEHSDRSDENDVCIQVSLDRTFITPEDIREFLRKHGITEIEEHEPIERRAIGDTRPSSAGPKLSFASGDSRYEFSFLKDGQLDIVIKYWKKTAAELEQARHRNIPHKFTDEEVHEAEQRIAKGEYSKAAETLIFRFTFHDRDIKDSQAQYDAMENTRNVLVKCYEAWGKKDVAHYLRVAPLYHIWGHANYGFRDPVTCFPTYDEYMARPWTIGGQTDSETNGEYHVSVNSLLQVDFFSKSPRYHKVWELVGPMSGMDKRVPPLPGTLVDEEIRNPAYGR